MDMKSTAQQLNVSLTAQRIDSNPDTTADEYTAARDKQFEKDYVSHWEITLRYAGKQITVNHSTVTVGGVPSVEEVLDCLFADYLEIEDALDFKDWAQRTESNPKSKAAKRTYKLHSEQRISMSKFFGDEAFDLLCNSVS